MFSGALFWFLMGMLTILVAAGAVVWAKDLGLKMTWWKWLLAVLWYAFLNFSVALPMTFLGENEAGAAMRTFLPLIVISLILGVGLWRILVSGQQVEASG